MDELDGLRPEQIVRYFETNGRLPDDFNPYGDYSINPAEDLLFIGELKPQTEVEGYNGSDFYFGINDLDPDRKSIFISLPKPPELKLIDGYGLNQDEQYFRRKETPAKLKKLELDTLKELQLAKKTNRQEAITGYKVLDFFWQVFDEEASNYKDEIQFIKHTWWHRIYGYWFFNDGKPTYITGRHFSFLTFFYMPDVKEREGFPEYRDRHRREFLFREFIRHTHHTFAKRDDKGWAVPEEDGGYQMIDMKKPIFLGDIHPKSRRNGSTIMGLHEMIEGAELGRGLYSTIISKDGDSTEEHFKLRLLPAWNTRPYWLRPVWKGGSAPEQIRYQAPNNSFGVESLNSVIDYTTSAGMVKKDGSKFNGFIVFDEEGKCYDSQTQILTYGGLPKKASEIQIGDIVVGDDGLPRKVFNLTRGRGQMYKVIPKKGEPWRCNGNHTIVAKNCDTYIGTKKGDVVEISVNDYMKLSKWNKRSLVLYKKGVYYPEQIHIVDPYLLGLWLGDGHSSSPSITNIDHEVISYLRGYCEGKKWNLRTDKGRGITHRLIRTEWVPVEEDDGQMAMFQCKRDIERAGVLSSHAVKKLTKDSVVSFREELEQEGVFNNKHIPDSFLYDSRENRLKLLAGLIDTDGYAYKAPRLMYEIIQVRKELAYQIYYLALGLGFYTSINFKETSYRLNGELHECDGGYRIKIHGKNLHEVPCLIKRKKYEPRELHINTREPLHVGFNIVEDGEDDFYGFEIEGNGRFLLADHTVVHNCTNVNVLDRWNVYKQAMTLGDGVKIIGWCSHISTVEEINASGKAFLDILDMSDFYQRGANGQTLSGLAAMFFPAYDGLEGFIDRFGMSVMNAPTDRQLELREDAEYVILHKGAYQYQTENRNDLINKGTPAAMQAYRSYIKKYPHRSSELTIGTSGDIGFDYEALDKRIAELRKLHSLGKSPVKRGSFHRENNNPDGRVYWRTEEEGRFEISMELPVEQANLKKRTLMWDVEKGAMVPSWEPMYKSRFSMGVDPFEYSNTKTDTGNSKQSDGSITVVRCRDASIDTVDDPREWHTWRIILTYRYRPASLLDFNEDCLMAAEYFGAMVFLERNKTGTWEHFVRRGRSGFLRYQQDLVTGKLADKPGYYAQGASKDEMFSTLKDYINYRIYEDDHLGFQEEARNIRAKDELTKCDQLASAGAAFLGEKSPHGKAQERMLSQSIDLSKSWLRM